MSTGDREPVGLSDHLTGAALCVLYVVLLLATASSIGMSRDESFYVQAAEQYAPWFELLLSNPERALTTQVANLQRTHEDALTRRAQADAMGRVWRERERDRRVLDKLEGRARTQHREEVERWDNAQLDEQALLRRAARMDRRREEDSSSPDSPSDT